MDEPIIPRKYLYTIKWTQPYATPYQRPYIRDMQEAIERSIEAQLERKEWPQASEIIERIRHASKS
jgi:hypothetical protein